MLRSAAAAGAATVESLHHPGAPRLTGGPRGPFLWPCSSSMSAATAAAVGSTRNIKAPAPTTRKPLAGRSLDWREGDRGGPHSSSSSSSSNSSNNIGSEISNSLMAPFAFGCSVGTAHRSTHRNCITRSFSSSSSSSNSSSNNNSSSNSSSSNSVGVSHYVTLGVKPTATQAEIRQARRND